MRDAEAPRVWPRGIAEFWGIGVGGGNGPLAGFRGRGRRDGTRGKTVVRAARGGALRSPVHGVGGGGGSRRAARPLCGDRPRLSSLLFLARGRSVHRWDRRHARTVRARVRNGGNDRRRR